MPWGKDQIAMQALRTAFEDHAAFEAVNLAGREGIRVLDVGCFDGLNTVLKFAPYSGIERVVGIDPEPDAIAEAAARTDDPRFMFSRTTFEDFDPEAGERFDVVYFSHVLQHLRDPQGALDKAHRLLAPGGFVIVKTTDDAAKLSFPDPENVMRRLFALYEEHVLPNTSWTACTDRYNGEKCYALMKRAGFENVRVALFSTDTAEKSPSQRHALFERCVYFRRNVPSCVSQEVAAEIRELVDSWEALFARDDYYFCTQTFMAIGQKLVGDAAPWSYAGPSFGRLREPAAFDDAGSDADAPTRLRLREMTEADLGCVMDIEVSSFRDPWTPLAFALELRHNPRSEYVVALAGDELAGYLGWWNTPEGAVIVRVAVDPRHRKSGAGRALVEHAKAQARDKGCTTLGLEVRSSNEGARAFYARIGFDEVATRAEYYDDPVEDAVVMALALP